jgi:hypothetical protein
MTDATEIEQLARAGAWFRRRDGWTAEACSAALGDVRHLDIADVERVAILCWCWFDSESPGRLKERGPWWPAAGLKLPVRHGDVSAAPNQAEINARGSAFAREQLAPALAGKRTDPIDVANPSTLSAGCGHPQTAGAGE